MKRITNRLLAVLLTITMVFFLLPVSVLAEPGGFISSGESIACTKAEGCEAETHEEGCSLYEESTPDAVCTKAEGCEAETHEEGCPLYEDYTPDAVCTKAEGCEAETHEEGCPLYEESTPDAVCTKTEDCQAETHEEGCPLYEESTLDAVCTKTEDCQAETHEEGCPLFAPANETIHTAADVTGMLENLPTAEELWAYEPQLELTPEDEGYSEALEAAMTEYFQLVRGEMEAARAALDSLSAEAKADVDSALINRLTELETAFEMLDQVMPLNGTQYVAEIEGGQQYETLAQAISEAESGKTIKLLAQVTEEIEIPSDKDLTLDLNGKELTSDTKQTVSVKGILIVKDSAGGGIIRNTKSDSNAAILICDGGSLALHSGAVEGAKRGIWVYRAGSSLLMTGGRVTSTGTLGIHVTGNSDTTPATAKISGGSVTGVTKSVAIYGNQVPGGNAFLAEAEISGSAQINTPTGVDNHESTVVVFGNGAKLLVSGGTIEQKNKDFAAISGGGTLNTDKDDGGTVIEITDGTITSTSSLAVYHPQRGELKISGGNITGTTGVEMRAGNLNISGDAVIIGGTEDYSSKPNGSGYTADNVGVSIAQHTTELPINVTISGGTISGARALDQANPQGNDAEAIEKITLNVEGGVFNGEIASANRTGFLTGGSFDTALDAGYIAEGYDAVEENNRYIIRPTSETNAAISIGSTYYSKLSDAIQSAKDGDTVKLLKDIIIDKYGISTVPNGKTINLNLNGCSITVTEDFSGRPIINEGTLTVTGRGTIDSSSSKTGGRGAIDNKGTLIINNGTFKGSIDASGAAIMNRAGAKLTVESGVFEGATCAIYNLGTAILQNGTYTGTTCSKCNPSSWFYTICNQSVDSRMTINGGTYTGVQGAVSSSVGYLEINNGTFTSKLCEKTHADAAGTFYALYAAGEVGAVTCIVNGGIFTTEGRVAAALIGNDNTGGDGGINAQATAFVYGGKFSAPSGVPALKGAPNTGDPKIFGGQFSSDITQYLGEGAQVKQVDNYYTVTLTSVAEINSKTYDTLADALNAATASDTVKLLKDVRVDKVLNIPNSDITLDLNGNTLTSTVTSGNGAIVVKKGYSFVLKNGSVVAQRPALYGSSNSVIRAEDCTLRTVGSGVYTVQTAAFGVEAIDLERCTISYEGNCGYPYTAWLTGKKITVKDCIITGSKAGYSTLQVKLTVAGGTAELTGNTITNTSITDPYAFGVAYESYGPVQLGEGNIVNGKIKLSNEASAGLLEILGGEYNTTAPLFIPNREEDLSGIVLVSGGYFKAAACVEDFLVPGCAIASNTGGNQGQYPVKVVGEHGDVAAYIEATGTYYDTLADALAAAGDNEVTLLKSVTADTLSGTIDGAGKTITFSGSLAALAATNATLSNVNVKLGDERLTNIKMSGGKLSAGIVSDGLVQSAQEYLAEGKLINTNGRAIEPESGFEAKIGGIGYTLTGATAVSARNSEKELIVLLKDVDTFNEQMKGNSYTIDLNGHTLGNKNQDAGFSIVPVESTVGSTEYIPNDVDITLTDSKGTGKILGKGYGVVTNGRLTGVNLTLDGIVIESDDFGVYFPSKDSVLTVKDCKITGKTGMAVKGGKVKISGEKTALSATGDASVPGASVEGGVHSTGDALYVECGYNYPIEVTISDGTFTSANGSAVRMLFDDSTADITERITIEGGKFKGAINAGSCTYFISGGYYTERPEDECLALSRMCTTGENIFDGVTYNFIVSDKEELNLSISTDAVVENSKVEVPGTLKDDDIETVRASAESVKSEDLETVVTNEKTAEIVTAEVQRSAVDALGSAGLITPGSEGVPITAKVVVSTYFEIEVLEYDSTAENPELVLDITPMYQLKATTAGTTEEMKENEGAERNTVAFGEPQPLNITETVTIKITLPDSFMNKAESTIFVKHTKDDGSVYYYPVTIDEGRLASFKNPNGFSLFSARIDTRTGTIDFGEAAGKETYKPSNVGDKLPVVSKPNYNFKGWKIGDKVYTTLTDDLLTLLDEAGDKTPAATAEFSRQSSGGGGGSSSTRRITTTNHDFWMDVRKQIEAAKAGDLIKVDAKGYDMMPVTVMDALAQGSVSLSISWTGGDTITIPAGQAQPKENDRVYWPLSKLVELYRGIEYVAPEQNTALPPAINSVTGEQLAVNEAAAIAAPAAAAAEDITAADITAADATAEDITTEDITAEDKSLEVAPADPAQEAPSASNYSSYLMLGAVILIIICLAVGLVFQFRRRRNG